MDDDGPMAADGRSGRFDKAPALAGMDVRVSRGRDEAATVAEVESLYFAATSGRPLYETKETAAHYAQLYGALLARPDVVAVQARDDGQLAGFAYGHPWSWAEQADSWADELRERLGEAAASLEGRIAVYPLAVHPGYRRAGLGRLLLQTLLDAAGTPHAWLITRDEPTPAMAIHQREVEANRSRSRDT